MYQCSSNWGIMNSRMKWIGKFLEIIFHNWNKLQFIDFFSPIFYSVYQFWHFSYLGRKCVHWIIGALLHSAVSLSFLVYSWVRLERENLFSSTIWLTKCLHFNFNHVHFLSHFAKLFKYSMIINIKL